MAGNYTGVRHVPVACAQIQIHKNRLDPIVLLERHISDTHSAITNKTFDVTRNNRLNKSDQSLTNHK